MGAGAVSTPDRGGRLKVGATPVGVVVALDFEQRTLACGANDAPRCLVGGVGERAAARAAARLVGDGARALVSWGVAAGLAADLGPGVLVVPERVRDGANGCELATDAVWRESLLARLTGHAVVAGGTLVSVASVLRSVSDKALVAGSGVAADMESAAVAKVAGAEGLAFIAVRAVLDPAGLSLPAAALDAARDDGSTDVAALVRGLVRDPRQVVPCLRVALAYRAARRALERAAARAGPALAHPRARG